jgi:hypothetical protein
MPGTQLRFLTVIAQFHHSFSAHHFATPGTYLSWENEASPAAKVG